MLSNSTNPWLQVNKSGVQLIHTLTPGYIDTPVENIALWVLYNRKTHIRLTRHPVTLAEIPAMLREAETTYGPAEYNAYPRKSHKQHQHYYCRIAYNTLEVYTLDDIIHSVYTLDGKLLWLTGETKQDKLVTYMLRRKYFIHKPDGYTLNEDEVAHTSRGNMLRRIKNGR